MRFEIIPQMKLRLIFFAVVVLIAAIPIKSDAQEEKLLTLEDIFVHNKFTSILPSNITWLPQGNKFIYFSREDPSNQLMLYDVDTGETNRIADWSAVLKSLNEKRVGRVQRVMGNTNATGRFRRTSLEISPDGSLLLGSTAGDLFTFNLASGESRFITDDPEEELFAAFSPDGKKVAFARKGDLYWIQLASGEIKRLTDRGENEWLINGVADWVYEEELSVRRSYWWSPDSTQIAYVQYDTSTIPTFPITDELVTVAELERQKYPKAGGRNSIVRLGVVNINDPVTVWLDTGDEEDIYIARVGWLPYGQELWYQWLNRDQNRFELRFADPVGRGYRTVIIEEDPTWINIRDDLTFVDDTRFIWSSERDGWRHLYLYDTTGTMLNRLTSGEWQVESVYGLSENRQTVYFQATEQGPLERHIYSVGIDGQGFKRLTQTAGTHAANFSPGGAFFIDTYSNVSTPPSVRLFTSTGIELALLAEGDIPSLSDYHLNPQEFGTVTTEDGESLYTLMIKPPNFDPDKKYPVLVYVYGGPHSQIVRNVWGGMRYLFHQLLAQHDLIIFGLDNRGMWGRGHAFESAVYRNLGEWELKDQLAGISYLKSLPYVDGDRIAVYGGSYGGYMTLTLMLKAPEVFKAGVSTAPVTDWRLYDTIYTERYMDRPQDNPDGYQKSAPLNFAENLKGNLLLIHGTMDNNVHLQNSIMMVENLVKAGKSFEFMVYPRERHGVRTTPRRIHYYHLITNFILDHLKN